LRPERRRSCFTADLEYDHPAGALVYNKHVVSGLQVNGYSNCDNRTPGELAVVRSNYGVGDSFVVSGMFPYMGDVFSGFGDEGGIAYNAETIGEVESFHSTIEAVDWTRDEITYAPGIVQAHTLSNSRPLINLNREKWITQGHVRIVAPLGTYKGRDYPGVTGGPGNVFNYQGGLIEGSADCPWDEAVIGRFLAVTDPSETLLPYDTSSVGGYAVNPSRPICRRYQIMDLVRNDDGTKAIRILRVRWSAVAAGYRRVRDHVGGTGALGPAGAWGSAAVGQLAVGVRTDVRAGPPPRAVALGHSVALTPRLPGGARGRQPGQRG